MREAYSLTRTSGARLISVREPGVMRMNCRPMDLLAAVICLILISHKLNYVLSSLTSMSIAILRLTESMYTSLGEELVSSWLKKTDNTYNSSKQRIGDPIASQSESKRHTCEKDFSPPDKVLAPRPVLSLVISGSTYEKL
jgi:hypothetical protein